jgi:hypothetical protein
VANVSHQFLVNLSQSLGVSYELKSKVLGSKTQPNSAWFNISQISSMLLNGTPIFGVYDDPSSFSNLSFNASTKNFQFSNGQVFFQGNLINIPSQIIPATSGSDTNGIKLFQFYLDYNDFILASTIFSAKVISVNGNTLTLDKVPPISYLNNFQTLNINNYLVNIVSIDINTNTVIVGQNIATFAFSGSTVSLLYQPVIKFITSFAITGQPPILPIPSTGIPFAQCFVTIADDSYSGSIEITYTAFKPYSDPVQMFPSREAYNAFLQSVQSSIRAYNNVETYDIEASILSSFSSYTQGVSTSNTSFDKYWHSQPFTPTDLFQYGINFNGLQKVDFDSRFKDFWYFYKNSELTRSYAIFRGDIYGGNAYVGQVPGIFPGTMSIQSFKDYSNLSSLYNGTYSYGISAVVPSGEYAPVFGSTSSYYFNTTVNNYLSWTSTSISNLLFYHIYKNKQTLSGFEQERLTNPNQIIYNSVNEPILTTLTTTQGVGNSIFAFKILESQSAGLTMGGLHFSAYIPDPAPLTGIQDYVIESGGVNYVSPNAIITGNGIGASVLLGLDGSGTINSYTVASIGSGYTVMPTITVIDSLSPTARGASIRPVLSQLNCGIYTGASFPSGTSIINLSPVNIAGITSSMPVNMPVSGANFVNLIPNTSYWAVFSMKTPYALSSNQKLNFFESSNYTTSFATSVSLSNFTISTSSVQVAKLGYVDQNSTGNLISSRGVFLTNDKSSYPTRVQIYIPNINLTSLGYDDVGQNATVNGVFQTSMPIQNSMIVSVIAMNSKTGITSTLVGRVDRNTARGTSILLGAITDLYDTVLDVFVQPNISSSAGMNYIPGTNIINWTVFDLFTVDSRP